MKYRRASVIALLACVFVATGSIQARSVVSLPTVNSVEEALKLMDAFEGEAENFRIAIPEQLFDIVGANEAATRSRPPAIAASAPTRMSDLLICRVVLGS